MSFCDVCDVCDVCDDTGSIYSLISLKLVKEWGWREEIVPIEEDEDEIGCIRLSLKLKGILFADNFLVIDKKYNILGTRALSHFSCIVDLEAQKLIFREFDSVMWEKQQSDTVQMEGRDVTVLADTGYEGFLHGSMALAQELRLQLKDISHKPITLSGFDGKNEVKSIAEEVCVGAYGVKRRGVLHLTQSDFGEARAELGIDFLRGARIRFEKGALQITFA